MFIDMLRAHRLLAIVRGSDSSAAARTVQVLADAGIRLIEVSLTSADACDVIAAARAALGPGFALGAGTVLSRGDAERAAQAGASFLVTPALVPDDLAGTGLPVVSGAFTPTEVAAAVRQGAAAVKLFPASAGGPRYLRALRDPFPAASFVPVGGVTLADAMEYLTAGACAIGAGSPLTGDAPSGGDLGQLTSRIEAWRDAGLIQ